MSLAAPGYLGLLALVPLVVYLHMRRHRSRRVPSTVVWKLVAEQAEPRPRLRPVRSSLSLWLQVATVALASLALAEPRLGSAEPTHRVLVIDAGQTSGARTASSGRTAYETAWQEWLDRVAPAPGGDELYSVWWVGPWTRPVALELRSAAAVRRALEATTHADAPSDWHSAAEALSAYELATADVTVVAGDLEAAEDALGALGAGSLEFKRMPTPGFNVALQEVKVELADTRTQRWSVEAMAQVTGRTEDLDEAVTFRVTFLPDGASVPLPYAEREVKLNMGGSARFRDELTLPGPGIIEVSVPSDDPLTSDSSARYRLDPSPQRSKAVVVSSLGAASPAARAVAATSRFDVELAEAIPADRAFDLVVIEGISDPIGDASLPAAAVLWLGSSPGREADLDSTATAAEVVRWDRDHPASRGTDWGVTTGARAFPLAPLGEVLVEGTDGPLVVARTTRTRREVIAAYDPSDASFVESDEFVTFMVDVLDWLVPPTPEVSACTVGLPCRVQWSAVASGFEAELDGAPTWRQPPPVGAVVPSRLDEAWVPTRAGLWWVTSADGERFAVPVNPQPSGRAGAAGTPAAGEPVNGPRLSLPWRGTASLLLLAAVVLVILEGLLAGRQPDGFWRPEGLGAPGATGRRNRRAATLHLCTVAAAIAAVAAAPFFVPAAANWLVVIGDGKDDVPTSLADWDSARTSAVPISDGGGAVDLERALAEATARVDPDLSLDIVVTAPLQATRGSTLRGIAPLLDRGATLHVVDATPLREVRDAVAADLLFSNTYFKGDALEVTALVYASTAMPADVRILLDDQLVEDRRVELPEGWSSYVTTLELDRDGTVALTLEVAAEGDEVVANDRRTALLEVRNGPRVTVYASDLARARAFADALELRGLRVDVKGPHAVGTTPYAFAGNDAVVLMDVAAIELARSQQEALAGWVREHGGGLALLGGERSFGPGGYLETPLDELSPLSAKISRDAPAVAMLFVLDRSGSMQQLVDGVSRLDIAKEATLAATALLGEGSEIAVVVFDEEARLLLPFTAAADRGRIAAALAPLVPGGGTALYPGLALAAEVLATTDASSKHVVVMTDGLSQPGDIDSVVERLVSQEATVSAIAIGTGADVERVRNIARIGKGTAHTTTDFRALPSILAQEAMLLAGDPVVREPVVPARTSAAASLMDGMPDEFPELTGLVETTPKVAATVLLEDHDGRPVLAAWRYGAGRVIAYTSQGVGPWSTAWSESEDFAGWWAQWLRWVVQPGREVGVDVQATLVGDEVRVDVVASDERGSPITGLQLTAAASQLGDAGNTDAARSSTLGPVRLAEVAPGQYRGHLAVREGVWHVSVADVSGGVAVEDTAMVAHSYASALGGPRPVDPVLAGLVNMTGGQLLTPTTSWSPTRASTWVVTRAWRPWLVVALALWSLFLVQRYAPTWLALPRLRSRRAPAPSAIGARTTAL